MNPDVLHHDGSWPAPYSFHRNYEWGSQLLVERLRRCSKQAEGLKEEARMGILADHRQGSAVTAATGHHAPTSGWWRPEGDPQTFRYMQRGETMPSLEGSQTLWTLVHELDASL